MKLLSLLCLLLTFHVHAFKGHDQFKVEVIKPWGEFGFRAIGKGTNITEMRLDCAKTSEMGLVLSVVNKYGKTSHSVLPAGQLGEDKYKCQKNLKKYFAGLYSKRGVASAKDKSQIRTLELSFVPYKKTLSFR